MAGQAIAANLQLQAVRGHLSAMNEQMAAQRSEQERQTQLRNYVFNMKTTLESASRDINEKAADYYLWALTVNHEMNENQITTASFSDLQDKEYCSKVLTGTRALVEHIESRLSKEQINQLKAYWAADRQLVPLKEVMNWMEIQKQLPVEPLGFLTKFWRKGGSNRLVLAFGMFFPFVNVLLMGAIVWRWVNFAIVSTKMKTIRPLAEENGGFITSSILKSEAKDIYATARRQAMAVGVPELDLADPKAAFEKRRSYCMGIRENAQQFVIAA